jgi:hypothetical protein
MSAVSATQRKIDGLTSEVAELRELVQMLAQQQQQQQQQQPSSQEMIR